MCSSRQCPCSDLAMVASSALILAVAQPGQLPRVPFADHDGFDDVHAGLAGDVSDDVLKLHVHLGQGLMHMLDVVGSVLHQHRPLSQVAAQASGVPVRSEGS